MYVAWDYQRDFWLILKMKYSEPLPSPPCQSLSAAVFGVLAPSAAAYQNNLKNGRLRYAPAIGVHLSVYVFSRCFEDLKTPFWTRCASRAGWFLNETAHHGRTLYPDNSCSASYYRSLCLDGIPCTGRIFP